MFDFQSILDAFGNENKEMLPSEAEKLREILMKVEPSDLISMDDHRNYIRLVRKFRMHVERSNKLNGANYLNTIRSLLSVGADGMYTNDLRFLFELIQNVDDCIYNNPADAQLNVRFDTQLGRIILEYNEKGFRPFDVFSITGIAEESKNISPDKIEIGEKGIGFKSVFGVADKVLIQSGMFSFMLYSNNITIPVDCYNGFTAINGTKLTLYLKTDNSSQGTDIELAQNRSQKCREIFQRIKEIYSGTKRKDALFRNNPVLFLNKLTYLRFFLKSDTFIEFSVPRTVLTDSAFSCEESIIVSCTIGDGCSRSDGSSVTTKNVICCYRYTIPITYNRQMCISRYGKDTAFQSGKQLYLQVLVPYPEYIKIAGNGALYSFLPTQVRTTVPIVCHIPFKLTNSREYVDSQNNNEWFSHSCLSFSNFMYQVYKDLAKKVHEQILYYVPRAKANFFAIDSNNDTLRCLKLASLQGSTIVSQPIFYAEGETFLRNSQVYSFDTREGIHNPTKLAELLPVTLRYFNTPSDIDVTEYGITVMQNAYCELFSKALSNRSLCNDAFDYLDEAKADYRKLIEETREKTIQLSCLEIISQHHRCFGAFNSIAEEYIKDGLLPRFSVSVTNAKNVLTQLSPDEALNEDDFEEVTKNYFRRIKYAYSVAAFEKGLFFPAENAIILSACSPMDSLGEFCLRINDKRFGITQKMRSASAELDSADGRITGNEYLKLLNTVRKNVRAALGPKGYNSYIKVIQDLGTSPKRFLYELLQNADDCSYPDGCVPSFVLKKENKLLYTEYNECGFTQKNVRAITAIGESTKQLLTTNHLKEIGEKGIGFKSVFGIADEVMIHSGDFFFSLKAETPTIPISPKNETLRKLTSTVSEGTKMAFLLRDGLDDSVLSPENLLSACLCLRKLKHLSINGTIINIVDGDNTRTVSIDNQHDYCQSFEFNTFAKRMPVPSNMPSYSRHEEFLHYAFYIPTKQMPETTFRLYNGLPTEVVMAVPFHIDAPFELEASREQVKSSEWNSFIKVNLYESYAEMLERMAPYYRINLMQFICLTTTRKSIKQTELFKHNNYLNSYDAFTLLQSKRVVPTCDKDYIATPKYCAGKINLFPTIIHYIMKALDGIDYVTKQMMVDQTSNESYLSKLHNLGIEKADPYRVIQILADYTPALIDREDYRRLLYSFLKSGELSSVRNLLRHLCFIPVKSRMNDSTKYIRWQNELYVDDTTEQSPESYWVLDTKQLEKDDLEEILSVSINTMNDSFRLFLYTEELKHHMDHDETEDKFDYFQNEFKNNFQQFQQVKSFLLTYKESIPLETEDGHITPGRVFLCNKGEGYFQSPILKAYIVAKSCEDLARFLELPDISSVTYEDLNIESMLTEDDIGELLELKLGWKVLSDCIENGYIDDALINKYGLNGLRKADLTEQIGDEEFPTEPIRNPQRLQEFIKKSIQSARRMISVKVERTEQRIEHPNGTNLSVDSEEIRNKTLNRYRSKERRSYCYCQSCLCIKPDYLMEVNNIVPAPKYYWPQMRIALCLNCSKEFKQNRHIPSIEEDFLAEILVANVQSDTPIDIPCGTQMNIYFTQTHLAEIQEILKSGKY